MKAIGVAIGSVFLGLSGCTAAVGGDTDTAAATTTTTSTGDTTTSTGDTTTSTGGTTGTGGTECEYPATWQGVQDFFVPNCDRCHATASGAARFDLRAEIESDIAAGGGSTVMPGHPEDSNLWLDISGGSFLTMPSDVGLLPTSEVCHVEEWIAAGAPLD